MPLSANQGMGYGADYFGRSDATLQTAPAFTLTSMDQDLYRTQQIVYGHTSWVNLNMGNNKYGRNSLSDVITEFYLMKQLQTYYLSTTVSLVEYWNGASWIQLSQAMINNYDFYNPIVRITYKSGLVVIADARSLRKQVEYPNAEPILRQGHKNFYFQYANGQNFTNM